jgi:hypothetical protein
MQNQNISQVDIIWMDLQGAELLALKGLDKYLDTVKYIFTEVSHQPIYTGQVMFNELNSFTINRGFISKNKLSMQGWQEDIIYENKNINGNNIFDIVIPVGPNDLEIIHKQIDYTKENIIGYRNIYLIYINDSLTVEGCITIVEKLFPFTINTVAEYHGKLERNGWYLQQLLKLYAGFVIPGILDKYLVIDADTFFLKPQLFYQENKCLYNYGYEYHKPYFEHLQRLSPDFHKMNQSLSGICHHMLFETKIVKEIIDIVEKKHGDIFYRIFLKNVTEKSGSGASEYELYFNYILDKHYDEIKIRPLIWSNISDISLIQNNNCSFYKNSYDYVSYHYYSRNKK